MSIFCARILKEIVEYLVTRRWMLVAMLSSVIGFLFMALPVVVLAFVFRWIRFIYINSEEQIKQNEQIISLLSDIKKQNEERT